ncbi:hypothetical protein TrST_g14319 [Triparma strigata]|uniref:Uncharacterized protein n=1 Tax=Triparma strigata TaxID=1606541 RepID=A0A9W7DY32_9STRA|nr:hypothetical protein TrST_g14319 [Triparma strigata]
MEVGLTQVITCGVLACAVIGRQELPNVARTAGLHVGRLVGALRYARRRVDGFNKETGDVKEINKLREEMRKGLEELDVVRRELSMATRDTDPGAMLRKVSGGGVGFGGVGGVADGGTIAATATTATAATTTSATKPTTTTNSNAAVTDFNWTSNATTLARNTPPRSLTAKAIAEATWDKGSADLRGGSEKTAELISNIIKEDYIERHYEGLSDSERGKYERLMPDAKQKEE